MNSQDFKPTVSESEHSTESSTHNSTNPKVETYLGMSGPKLNYAIATFAGVGFLLFGYDQGVYGSLLSLPSFENQFPAIRASANSTLQGAVIGVYELGCLVSALSTVYLGDRLGRLKCMFLGCVIVLVGAVLQATAYTVVHLAIARVVTGFGTGYLTATVPVWQSELSRAKSRGKLIMMQGSLITLGIAISYWIDFGFYFINRNGADPRGISWRIPVVLQIVFPILLLPVCFKLPESPRWLCAVGRSDDARRVFSAIYALPSDDDKISQQLAEIQSSLDLEAAAASTSSTTTTTKRDPFFKISKLFKQGQTRNFHRLCLACWSQIMQQISGINLITYYAGTIFENYIGMSAFNARILAACNGTEYFLASLFGILLIEKVGRRRLLFWGAIGQAVTMAVLTISGWQAKKLGDEGRDNTGAGIAAAVFLFVFNSIFAISYLGGTWLYPPEIASLQLRAATASLSTASNWIFNFLVVMITPIMFSNIGYYTYTIFACINAAMAAAVFVFYPETSGRSLEEMDHIFNKCPVNQPWKVVGIERNTPKRSHDETRDGDVEKPLVEHRENTEKDSRSSSKE
ncbi:uncharacterized protein LODBEIA_P58760 [Lodderomyces beijingensis]|uniref:Major facilitator superfamily (MFS) profile domain-containing protein n=1 Tax=Lodderomyces beijingensis TaxID=1775926 RepID=A0ABP0ZU47_9ASCO